MQSIAGGLRRWQNGFVRSYILTVVIGMLVILTFLAFRM
jgi:hypothetical protein